MLRCDITSAINDDAFQVAKQCNIYLKVRYLHIQIILYKIPFQTKYGYQAYVFSMLNSVTIYTNVHSVCAKLQCLHVLDKSAKANWRTVPVFNLPGGLNFPHNQLRLPYQWRRTLLAFNFLASYQRFTFLGEIVQPPISF